MKLVTFEYRYLPFSSTAAPKPFGSGRINLSWPIFTSLETWTDVVEFRENIQLTPTRILNIIRLK